jgi:hypothetical protein
VSSVANQFLTGKLTRLRGMIVHDGKRVTIRLSILRYLEFLYADVFFQELGLSSEQWAAAFLASYTDLEKDLNVALA